MTLDVRIGKAQIKDYDNHFIVDVVKCPELDYDLCKPCFTLWPRESYRSGSTEFWEFFTHNPEIRKIYHQMRDFPDCNDYEVIKIIPFIDKINALSIQDFKKDSHKDRLKWLKFWCKKAIELYGDLAAISFS